MSRTEHLPPPPLILSGVQNVEFPQFEPERVYHEYTLLIPRQVIQARIRGLAKEIADNYIEKRPFILVGLTNGGAYLATTLHNALADLQLHVPLQLTYGSQYDEDENPSNRTIVFEPSISRTPIMKFARDQRTVIIADDIADRGATIVAAENHIEQCGFKTVETVVLFNKPPEARQNGLEAYIPTYYGFDVPNLWYAGSGMNTKINDPAHLGIADYSRSEDREGLGRGWGGLYFKTITAFPEATLSPLLE